MWQVTNDTLKSIFKIKNTLRRHKNIDIIKNNTYLITVNYSPFRLCLAKISEKITIKKKTSPHSHHDTL